MENARDSLIVALEDIKVSSKRHHVAAQQYMRKNTVFQIGLIIVASVNSVVSVLPDTERTNPWSPIHITYAVLTQIVTGLTVLNKFLLYEQKAERHYAASKAYLDIYTTIRTHILTMEPEDHKATLAMALKQIQKVRSEAPLLPSSSLSVEMHADPENEIQLATNHDPITLLELHEFFQ
jgi:hypothetical protein